MASCGERGNIFSLNKNSSSATEHTVTQAHVPFELFPSRKSTSRAEAYSDAVQHLTRPLPISSPKISSPVTGRLLEELSYRIIACFFSLSLSLSFSSACAETRNIGDEKLSLPPPPTAFWTRLPPGLWLGRIPPVERRQINPRRGWSFILLLIEANRV